ncbi:hypothetical protein GQ55_9G383200 [Panicum hallii var. hallii]|uniref:Uncharacterized protein n=1 Tax=Panicum hallii var. hallii TaxID=1504633 RepID=A0A2T7C9B9_9POAL|nr:hypothetical protein GQ55_9G383200 [Panicum hallii var. hallii]
MARNYEGLKGLGDSPQPPLDRPLSPLVLLCSTVGWVNMFAPLDTTLLVAWAQLNCTCT